MSRLFSNSGATNFVFNPYIQQLNRSSQIRIAAPYVTQTEHLVDAVKNGKRVSLIAGVNECTSPNALRALLDLPNCAVRYFTNRFHAKIYVFDDAALIGSSNLTDGGMRSNREATILVENTEDLDALRALFLELWESAQNLTPQKLEAFAGVYHRPIFTDGDPRIADAVGRSEPRNIAVRSTKVSSLRIFVEELRRRVYEQYKPSFAEVMESLQDGGFHRPELEDLGPAFETNRFLNWVRLTQAPGEEAWRQASIKPQNQRQHEILRLGQEWVESDNSRVPADYPDYLREVQRVFGTADSLEYASREDISSGLLSLHAFSEQLRFVKGGRAALAPFFWQENQQDESKVKRSLTNLLHGRGDFIDRLHDVIYDPEEKLAYFGQFCAIELFGTIKPQECPPVNGRMAKALKFLGYDVKAQ